MSSKNPFGDEIETKRKVNPFGEDANDGSVKDAAARMEAAARKIRQLKTQMGAEGLTLTATRDLIDEISVALDMGARALRDLDKS